MLSSQKDLKYFEGKRTEYMEHLPYTKLCAEQFSVLLRREFSTRLAATVNLGKQRKKSAAKELKRKHKRKSLAQCLIKKKTIMDYLQTQTQTKSLSPLEGHQC